MDDDAADPALAEIEREWPRWHTWKGIAGLLYARRNMTSPPVLVRDENATELLAQIRSWEATHRRD